MIRGTKRISTEIKGTLASPPNHPLSENRDVQGFDSKVFLISRGGVPRPPRGSPRDLDSEILRLVTTLVAALAQASPEGSLALRRLNQVAARRGSGRSFLPGCQPGQEARPNRFLKRHLLGHPGGPRETPPEVDAAGEAAAASGPAGPALQQGERLAFWGANAERSHSKTARAKEKGGFSGSHRGAPSLKDGSGRGSPLPFFDDSVATCGGTGSHFSKT